MKPYVVYYLPYEDERFMQRQTRTVKDYVCCVNAETVEEAVKKTTHIAMAHGANYVKIMGVAPGRPEWVNENAPLS